MLFLFFLLCATQSVSASQVSENTFGNEMALAEFNHDRTCAFGKGLFLGLGAGLIISRNPQIIAVTALTGAGLGYGYASRQSARNEKIKKYENYTQVNFKDDVEIEYLQAQIKLANAQKYVAWSQLSTPILLAANLALIGAACYFLHKELPGIKNFSVTWTPLKN